MCEKLTSFYGKLSSLTNGKDMFRYCKLDTDSIVNIAEHINTPSTKGTLDISIASSAPSETERVALDIIASRNWTVRVNGKAYTPSSVSSVMTLDEDGNEVETPIPYYAKPAQSDEQHARYTDSEGNYYNILGAQFIFGDDLSTYGMFTCEDDAALNMGLTKI
jgi:hypothetical protein